MAKSPGGNRPRNENPPPKTPRPIREIASEAMRNPGSLSRPEIRTLGASSMRHIEPRRPSGKK
jgi:hypothetical protein